MNVKTFVEEFKISEYQHVVIIARNNKEISPLGGGTSCRVSRLFGSMEIQCVSVYDNIIRICVASSN